MQQVNVIAITGVNRQTQNKRFGYSDRNLVAISRMISFKVYLTRENVCGKVGAEIRRFEMEQDATTSFFKWNMRLKSIFSKVDWDRSRISWRDSEGDDIAISSDSELNLALREMSGQAICRFYVVEFKRLKSLKVKQEKKM